MRFGLLAFAVAALAPVSVACAQTRTPAVTTPAPACAAAEFRQFDFWLGAWRVTSGTGQDMGATTNTPISGGCGFIERVTTPGTEGVAENVFDPARGTWSQLWTAPGSVVRLEGRAGEGGVMTMEGTIASGGHERPLRVIWTPQADASVKQDFFVKDASGAWTPLFSRIYRRA